jgi:hypothetical protein
MRVASAAGPKARRAAASQKIQLRKSQSRISTKVSASAGVAHNTSMIGQQYSRRAADKGQKKGSARLAASFAVGRLSDSKHLIARNHRAESTASFKRFLITSISG